MLTFPRTRSLVYGFTLPLHALRLIISHPTLIFLSVLPIVVTLTLYYFVITRLQTAARAATLTLLQTQGFATEGVLATLALALTWLVLLVAGALVFSFVAGIAASPFNDFLAEKTELLSTPPLRPVEPASLRAKIWLIAVDLGKTLLTASMGFMAIILSWVPILNLAAFGLAFLLVSFQFISYPQTRRGIGIRAGLQFLTSHPFACLGFGSACSALFAVPLLSSLALPLAVVGGTLLYARAESHDRLR